MCITPSSFSIFSFQLANYFNSNPCKWKWSNYFLQLPRILTKVLGFLLVMFHVFSVSCMVVSHSCCFPSACEFQCEISWSVSRQYENYGATQRTNWIDYMCWLWHVQERVDWQKIFLVKWEIVPRISYAVSSFTSHEGLKKAVKIISFLCSSNW